MVGYERRTGKHGFVPKRLKVEYSSCRDRIVPKATTLVPMFPCLSRVYELVVGKQGKKEYPHLDKKTHQPERRLTNGNE